MKRRLFEQIDRIKRNPHIFFTVHNITYQDPI